jgi:nucleoside-diphosphate-sugar epimerase
MAALISLFLVVPGVFERRPIADRRLQTNHAAAAGSVHGGGFTRAFATFCIRFAPAIVAVFFAAMAFAGAGVPGIQVPGVADVLLGDPTKARQVLGWEATTTMEEMIREMVDADLARHSHGSA